MSDVIAEKFCRLAKTEGEAHDECVEIMRQISGSVGIKPDIGGEILERLSRVTGKSLDEIMQLFMFSCPLCPE